MVVLGPRVLGELGRDALPVPQDADGVLVDKAVLGADTGQVDLADEVDQGRLFRVVRSAVHLELVDAVLVVALGIEQAMVSFESGGIGLSELREGSLTCGGPQMVPRQLDM